MRIRGYKRIACTKFSQRCLRGMGISQFFRRSRGVGWELFTKAKLVGWTSLLGFVLETSEKEV